MNLDHHGRQLASFGRRAGNEPGLDLATVDGHPALGRGLHADLRQDLVVAVREPPKLGTVGVVSLAVRTQIDEVDVAERSWLRPDDGDADPAVGAPYRAPAGQVVATLRQALRFAVIEGNPPQLIAAADRCREEEMPAVRGGPQVGRLARRDVADHPRAGHQVVPGGEVASCAPPGLAPIRREQPDVVAAATGPRVPVTQHGHGSPIREPGRGPEGRASAIGDPDVAAGRDLHHADVELPVEVRMPTTLGDVGDTQAVR